jgi:hypothetical protein
MRKPTPAKKTPEPNPDLFDPTKETKKEREARLNAIVKKALESVTSRAVHPTFDAEKGL